MICAVIHTDGPSDPNGCVLPVGHPGPHEFIAGDGQRFQWETDLTCGCSHCKAEGDFCTEYWPVPTSSSTPAASAG